jgi:hypothetical protein
MRLENPQQFFQLDTLFEAHTATHKEQIMQKMQQMIAMQQGAPA